MLTRYVLGFFFLDNPADPNLLQVVLVHKDAGPPNVVGRWNGHGGKLEPGETPTDTMICKTREELQVETVADDWMPFGELRGDGADGRPYVVYLFAGRMPEGQVATQGGREQVGVHVAAECVGEGYVSNIPVLLQAAELALFEPVWITLLAMKDAGAVRKKLANTGAVDEYIVGGAMRETYTPEAAADLAEKMNRLMQITPILPGAGYVKPTIKAGELVGGHFDFGDGQKRPIVASTEGTWTHERPLKASRVTHIALMPEGQQPDPNCTLWTPDLLSDRSDPEIEANRIGGGGDCEGIQATATLIPPPVFTIDLARYNRSETHPSVPLEDGGEMAVASCWTDWRALAADLEAAGMPPELVDAVGVIGEEDFEEDGVPVQEAAPEELKLSDIYSSHAAAIVAREFISGRREWLSLRARPDQITITEEGPELPDDSPFNITRILGDARLSTSARALNTPDLPGIRWAAKGEAATTPEERTVKAEWGIAFDGEREAICYVTPNSGPGQAPFEKVQLYWLSYHGGPSNRDPIDWPFVEDSADRKHFEALGFRVIGKVE